MAVSTEIQKALAEFFVEFSESQDPEITAEEREMFARNAVRVAYYACFHAALEWAESRGYEKPENWGSHEALWDCWYKQEPETQAIKRRGNALKAKRVQADYKIGEPFTVNARAAFDEAEEFMELIRKDQARVKAMPPQSRRVAWDKTAYPNPRRRTPAKKK